MKKRSDSINRLIYTLILLSIFILIGIGAFAVNAYGTSNPVVFGHSAGEIEGLETGIPTGFCIFSRTQVGCPIGWTRDSGFDSRTIRGDLTPGGTGGSESHSHTGGSHAHSLPFSLTSNVGAIAFPTSHPFGDGAFTISPGRYAQSGDTSGTVASASSSTDGAGATSTESSWAPYVNVIVCCKD